MIRHTKDSLKSLPKPVYIVTKLQMSASERDAYNTIVALAKANLVLTG